MATHGNVQARLCVRATVVVLITAVASIAGMTRADALTPEPVVGGAAKQEWPSTNGTHLAWTAYTVDGPAVLVKQLPSGVPVRVNPVGTEAERGSFVGASDVIVYEQWTNRVPGDVFFYDVSERTRSRAPAAVNRAANSEWSPVASDAYIAFVRHRWSREGVLLERSLIVYDRGSGTATTLVSGVSPRRSFWPSYAGPTYVAYTVCSPTACSAYYWSVADGVTRIPSPSGAFQYSPTIDETDGIVYFNRSNGCGRGVTIRRGSLTSGGSIALASLQPGIDAGFALSVAADPGTGHEDLYFARYSCRLDTTDIYALRSVDTA